MTTRDVDPLSLMTLALVLVASVASCGPGGTEQQVASGSVTEGPLSVTVPAGFRVLPSRDFGDRRRFEVQLTRSTPTPGEPTDVVVVAHSGKPARIGDAVGSEAVSVGSRSATYFPENPLGPSDVRGVLVWNDGNGMSVEVASREASDHATLRAFLLELASGVSLS